ncbi:MAG: hypothetical protein U5K56_21630 [Halioglobus sp.]|nr:hypothetical protein [Halioglobus sp.]
MKFVLSTSFSSVAHLTRLAPVADSHGWYAMSFSDHVVNPQEITTPYPYTEDGSRRWEPFTDWPDPWVMIGALATITERLRLPTIFSCCRCAILFSWPRPSVPRRSSPADASRRPSAWAGPPMNSR